MPYSNGKQERPSCDSLTSARPSTGCGTDHGRTARHRVHGSGIRIPGRCPQHKRLNNTHMNKHITTLALFITILLTVFPVKASCTDNDPDRSDANIIGHVTDKNTGEHLPYINVTLKGTMLYTATDATGHYFLKDLPEGDFTVEVTCMGYKSQSREVSLKKGVTLELNFEIEEDISMLDGVVVSANRSVTTRQMAPTIVNVMTPLQFDNLNASTVSSVIAFQPGVRVENSCQNCGFQQVRINGLDGPYTQILIDSRPVFSALSNVYGIEQLPVSMVDRVEVMRGGGSALFGSSAIAGTINIITKEPLYNSAQLSHTYTNIGGTSAGENNTSLNASLVSDDYKLGIAVFGQNRQRDAYDADGDGYTELPMINAQTLGTRSYLKTGLHSRLTAEYHHLSEKRRGGNSLDLPPHEADIAEQVQHSINTGGLKFDYFSPDGRHKVSAFASAQHINRESYYGAGKDPNAYGETTDLTWVAGAQYDYSFNKCIFMPADLTIGAEFNQDLLHDMMTGYGRDMRQDTWTASVFTQNEWKNDKFGILIGGRLDKHNLIDAPVFSPRATLRYNPTGNINLRASYSSGFRAPQAFDEDLHIDNVGGTVSMIRLADDLKVEKSHSVSVSADMYMRKGNWQGNLLVEGFFTSLNNVFALRDIGFEDGILIKERYNESGARVYGGTIEGKLAWKNIWQIQAGFTLQRAEYKEARVWSEEGDVQPEKRMFRTPEAYGYFTTSVNPVTDLALILSGTYTDRMLVEHHQGYIAENRTELTPRFFELNFKVTYDFRIYNSITLQINAGVGNILNSYQRDFDQGPDRDSGYIYGPGMPRTYFAGIKLSY